MGHEQSASHGGAFDMVGSTQCGTRGVLGGFWGVQLNTWWEMLLLSIFFSLVVLCQTKKGGGLPSFFVGIVVFLEDFYLVPQVRPALFQNSYKVVWLTDIALDIRCHVLHHLLYHLVFIHDCKHAPV